MDFLQQVGYATFTSSGAFPTPDTNKYAYRVFDFAYAVTGDATAHGRLWNLTAGYDTTGTLPVICINNSVPYIHSDVGYRFPNGFYVWSVGTSVSVNYITELK
jgi:hypothetical protein